MRWLALFLSICLMIASGCSRLATGPIESIQTGQQVCLIRGFQDWYSTGIDRLSQQLCSIGIQSQIYRDEQWENVADRLIQTHASPIILVGFSYGADDVIMIAEKLSHHDLNVRLLITIDPVTPDRIPQNVQTCINFYQSNGLWDIFPWLRGVPLEKETGSSIALENINLRRRLDLLVPNTSHATIAANQNVHREIIEMIQHVK